jgi:circadian clock protein KaiB
MTNFTLSLFISGNTALSKRAVCNVHKLCRKIPAEDVELHVIDILEKPEEVEAQDIIVAPTLLLTTLEGQQRFVGEFDSTDNLSFFSNPNG